MDYKDFTIVLPTYNEEDNVGVLIRKLLSEYKGINVIVADDGSRDKTRKVVLDITKTKKTVWFMDRAAAHRQRGLTTSAIDGIRASKTKFAIVMDADLQHPTGVIKKMAANLAKGDDLVVAIRADVKGWQLYRKIISKTLISFGWLLLVLTGKSRCNDIFSGFFGVNRKQFEKVYRSHHRRFVGGGYKILYDYLKCTRNGEIKISEVPYSFGLRRYGESKAGFKQGMLLFKSFFS